MATESFESLLGKIKANPTLREKIRTAVDVDTVVALANSAGIPVSKSDWIEYQAERNSELSDEALEKISGGANPICSNDTWECGTDASTEKECWCGH